MTSDRAASNAGSVIDNSSSTRRARMDMEH
jgi:hypothetical protein